MVVVASDHQDVSKDLLQGVLVLESVVASVFAFFLLEGQTKSQTWSLHSCESNQGKSSDSVAFKQSHESSDVLLDELILLYTEVEFSEDFSFTN